MKKETLTTIVIFVFAILIALFFGYVYLKKTALAPIKGDVGKISTSTASIPKDYKGITKPENGTIGNRTRAQLPPFPLNWDKINYGSGVAEIPAEAKKRQEDQFKIVVGGVNKSPDSIDLWIDLGLIKKVFEDYAGARDAWEYGSLIRPKGLTSYLNLGDLYWHFLPDFPKAEFNYKKALENSPETLGIYKDLSDLYRFSYKEKVGLADDILLEGLSRYPKNASILIWLAGYYRDIGDKNNAIKYYTEALKVEPMNDSVKRELELLK